MRPKREPTACLESAGAGDLARLDSIGAARHDAKRSGADRRQVHGCTMQAPESEAHTCSQKDEERISCDSQISVSAAMDPSDGQRVIQETLLEAQSAITSAWRCSGSPSTTSDGICAHVIPRTSLDALAASTSKIHIGFAVAQSRLHHRSARTSRWPSSTTSAAAGRGGRAAARHLTSPIPGLRHRAPDGA